MKNVIIVLVLIFIYKCELQAQLSQKKLFSKDKVYLQFNNLKGSSFSQVQNDKFLSYKENVLQIWSFNEKKLLHEYSFENSIDVFLQNSEAIIIEYKDEENLIIRKLNLESGLLISNPLNKSESEEFNNRYKCDCEYFENLNSWLCSDRENGIWEIKHESLTVKKLFTFSKRENRDRALLKISKHNKKLIVSHESVDYKYGHLKIDSRSIENEYFEKVLKDSIVSYNTENGTLKREYNLEQVSKTFFSRQEKNLFYMKNDTLYSNSLDFHKQKALFSFNNQDLSNFNLYDIKINRNYVYLFLEDISTNKNYEIEDIHGRIIKINIDNVNEYRVYNNPFAVLLNLPRANGHIVNDLGLHDLTGMRFLNLDTQEVKHFESGINTYEEFSELNSININSKRLSINNQYYDWLDTRPLNYNDNRIGVNYLSRDNSIDDYFVFTNTNDEEILFYKKSFGRINKMKFKFLAADENFKPLWESNEYEMDKNFHYKTSENGDYIIIFDFTSEQLKNNFFLFNTKKRKLDVISLPDTKNNELTFNPFFSQSNDKFGIPMRTKKGTYITYIYDSLTQTLLNKIDGVISAIDKEGNLYKSHYNSDISFSNGISIIDPYTGNVKKEIKSINENPVMHNVYLLKNYVIAPSLNHNIHIWKNNETLPSANFNFGSNISSIDEFSNRIFILLENGEIRVISNNSLKLVVTGKIFSLKNGFGDKQHAILWFTPDGYYMGDKEVIKNSHFVYNDKATSLRSFDLIFNRPDIVLERLKVSDDNMLKVLKNISRIRLKKYGFHNGVNFSNLKLPEIIISNKNDINPIVSKDVVKLFISVDAGLDILKEIKVNVNGVPIKHNISVKNNHRIENDSLDVPLHFGENTISISAINSKNIESLIETISIKNTKKIVSQIYYIGLGVSKYKDTSMNLTYARKDINDIAKKMKSKYKERIIIDTLLNEKVTKENFLKLKKTISKANENDVVILSFSGHGLIDELGDFYFGTNDIDFENPSQKGIDFNDIEMLFNSSSARKRLVLMDACHSGESLSEYGISLEESLDENVVTYTTKGSIGSSIGKNNDLQIQKYNQMLFSNLNNMTGAVIIAASGNKEYAFEGAEWENGVFTYTFLKGIFDLGNPFENEGKIRISNLTNYIVKNVYQLTKGLQNPNTRSENIDWDWSF
ncbi:caspase family protein [Aureibaculum sp. 2210JD6-5]|uniref:caspase family protein n=1 Tax=Aureibaculum sp. 2210JD6-5 TaxID=3103957 RepID=UPI002AAC7089|nr:caspase family protein [Aureibaculum sp. 2210JD6-5]MDY7396306.1 caspase family protein [Aureibaculum sp. 2210JD6-5]